MLLAVILVCLIPLSSQQVQGTPRILNDILDSSQNTSNTKQVMLHMHESQFMPATEPNELELVEFMSA